MLNKLCNTGKKRECEDIKNGVTFPSSNSRQAITTTLGPNKTRRITITMFVFRLCPWFCTSMFLSFASEIINDWTGLNVPEFSMTCQHGAGGGGVQKVSFGSKRAPVIIFTSEAWRYVFLRETLSAKNALFDAQMTGGSYLYVVLPKYP